MEIVKRVVRFVILNSVIILAKFNNSFQGFLSVNFGSRSILKVCIIVNRFWQFVRSEF